jgi:type II secretory pathway component PulK
MRATSALPSARRGSVIVIVLVMIMLASLMLVKFMETSAVELTLATRQADRERLRADAYSALETLLAVLAEVKAIDEDRINAPEQGWGDPYAYSGEAPREGVTVTYAFTDESGKLSLPNMSLEELVELSQVLGLTETDAKRFADSLFAWMKEDHVAQDIDAEASRYEREDPPITVPKRSLRSWEELRSVRVARDYVYEEGQLTAFGQGLRENISLYAYEGVNVNALAPSLGLARGWDPTQLEQIAGYRAGAAAGPARAPPPFSPCSGPTRTSRGSTPR